MGARTRRGPVGPPREVLAQAQDEGPVVPVLGVAERLGRGACFGADAFDFKVPDYQVFSN